MPKRVVAKGKGKIKYKLNADGKRVGGEFERTIEPGEEIDIPDPAEPEEGYGESEELFADGSGAMSAAEKLRAAYGETESGEIVKLSKKHGTEFYYLTNITPEEAANPEVIKQYGKGEGIYKVDLLQAGVVIWSKIIPIGVPDEKPANPLEAILSANNQRGGSDVGTMVAILSTMLTNNNEQMKVALEREKSELSWKMKQLEEDNKVRIEQMKADRDQQIRETERQEKAQERMFNLMLAAFKKDDSGTMLNGILGFLGTGMQVMAGTIAKAGKQEPEGVIGLVNNLLPHMGELAAILQSLKKAPAPQAGATPAINQPNQSFTGPASTSPGSAEFASTAEAGSGNGAPTASPVDLNVLKQRFEQQLLPILYGAAPMAHPVGHDGEGFRLWEPEDYSPAVVAATLLKVITDSNPGYTADQAGTLFDAAFGGVENFLGTYQKMYENEYWFRDFYMEVTGIEPEPIIDAQIHEPVPPGMPPQQ